MTVAVVPVKALARAKSRLAGLLSPPQRQALCLAMLHDVLAALLAAPGLQRVLVASQDAAVLAAARAAGAVPYREQAPDLNGALREVARSLPPDGALLVVPGDVPRVRPADVTALLAAAPERGGAIAGTADGGTGALFLRPATVLPLLFGPDSFRAHLAAAELAGLELRTCQLPRLAWDIDQPDDLLRLPPDLFGTATGRFLQEAGLRSPQPSL